MQNFAKVLAITTLFFSCPVFLHAGASNAKPTPTKAETPPKKVETPAKPAVPAKTEPPKKEEAASESAKKQQADLSKLADAIQKQYNQTKSATFKFEQTYHHPFLASQESSKGEVSYNKSTGSMMWNYLEPKSKQKKFFINRNKFTFYSISDKIAYTHDCYDKDTLSASVTFLLGTGNLKNSFTIAPFEGDPKSALTWISLTPKEANAPVKKISLGATSDGRVIESIVEDPSGGKNHFKFIDFKANPKIAESVFIFKAPPDVIVQPMPNISCPAPKAAPPAPTPAKAKPEAKPAPVKKKS